MVPVCEPKALAAQKGPLRPTTVAVTFSQLGGGGEGAPRETHREVCVSRAPRISRGSAESLQQY